MGRPEQKTGDQRRDRKEEERQEGKLEEYQNEYPRSAWKIFVA